MQKGFIRRLSDFVRWLGLYELAILVVVALVAGSLWAFVELADDVIEGETQAYDRALLLGFRNPHDTSDPLGPEWVEELGRDFTALGGVGILTFITLSATGFLAIQGKFRAALLILVATGGGLAVSMVLKGVFERPRPDLVAHASYVYTTSFPSGHSMMSAVVYLTLGALLARLQPRRRLRVYLLALAIVLTVLVGVSRVYLGVHWPTDVLAGWSIGVAWALLCWLVARWMQNRGHVEQEKEQAP